MSVRKRVRVVSSDADGIGTPSVLIDMNRMGDPAIVVDGRPSTPIRLSDTEAATVNVGDEIRYREVGPSYFDAS